MAAEAPPPKPGPPGELFPETRFDAEREETALRGEWAALGDFRRPGGGGDACAILLEPFGAEGPLRMGDALGPLLADILARHRSMTGNDVLLVAGLRHASAAPREARGPEETAPPGAAGHDEERSRIGNQLQALGVCTDPAGLYFTLDDRVAAVVREAFFRFFDQGLVYREKKLASWCCACKEMVSDKNLDTQSVTSTVWTVRYPIKGAVEKFLTATVAEPETLAGDVALLVRGDDERYAEVLGGTVLNPLTGEPIPVLVDDRVDPRAGTGVVRLTPCARPEDFERARALEVQAVALFGLDGCVGEGGGPLQGLDAAAARAAAVEILETGDLVDRQEEATLERPVCARCRQYAIPVVSEQWFLRLDLLAARAAQEVREGKIRFRPKRWEKAFLAWADTATPWRISLQNARGQGIDVVFCARCETPHVGGPPARGCRSCGSDEFREGADVLDPWFSAALAPFAALGWPEQTGGAPGLPAFAAVAEQSRFHLWAARLLALGTALAGQAPVRQVLVHGQIVNEEDEDEEPEKASSLEDADPRDVVRTRGADALRLSLCESLHDLLDVRFSPERFEAGQHFVNKLWNAARFAARHFSLPGEGGEGGEPLPEDRWILSRLNWTVRQVDGALDEFDPGAAAVVLTEFVRHDLCAWYLEMAKRRIRSHLHADAARKTLGRIILTLLRALHPLVPFVSETIWRRLMGSLEEKGKGRSYPLLWSPWPSAPKDDDDPETERRVELLQSVVRAARSLRSRYRIPRAEAITLLVSFDERTGRDTLRDFRDILKSLVNAEDVNVGVQLTKPASCATEVLGSFQVFVPLGDTPRMRRQLGSFVDRKSKIEDRLLRISRPLESWEFARKAPKEVRERLRQERELLAAQLHYLEQNVAELQAIEKPRPLPPRSAEDAP